MKKIIVVALALAAVAMLVAGCGGCGGAKKFKDGVYYASADSFQNGWKGFVTVVVKKGKIVSADWDAVSETKPVFKKAESKAGNYVMSQDPKALKWHEQAALVEAYLIKTQDPAKITYKDAEGHTDAISGATIHVKEFFDLVQKALAGEADSAEKIAARAYKDGTYRKEAAEFVGSPVGWKDYVEVFVKGGRIVFIRWNAFTNQGADKKSAVARGLYKMANETATWTQQSEAVCAYIVKTQDPFNPPKLDDKGHTDAISGATMSVKACFDLVAQALKPAQ